MNCVKPRCEECPLKSLKRVNPPVGKQPVCIVGEAPGRNEEKEGQYFIGESGHYLDQGLRLIGKTRQDIRITNALQCRPQSLGREATNEEWKTALACCKPRLESDLKGTTHILAAGKRAFHAVTTYKDALVPWLGAPQVFDNRTVVPSFHPAYCLRGMRQYLPIFYTFLERVFDLQRNVNVFSWQPLAYFGGELDAERVLQTILDSGLPVGIDIETAGRDPLTSGITALGLATEEVGASILWPPIRHVPGDRKLAARIRHLCGLILRSNAPKICHNGAHDITGLRQHGFSIKNYTDDTLLMHHVAGPTLKHDLGFVSQVEFACDPWKKLFKVVGDVKGLERFLTAKPEELTRYNAKDAAILPRLLPRLQERLAQEHNGETLYRGYFTRSVIAARMRARGILIDKTAVTRHLRSMAPKIGKAEAAIKRISNVNVASLPDMRKLFFTTLKQVPVSVTEKTGAGKLDAKSLEAFCASSDGRVREIARNLLIYREWTKLRSTYLRTLKTDEVHPSPKVWGTKTGRWSYEDPAIQTIPPELRDCFAAREGHWIVEADYSQLELRIIALLAQDQELLQWYKEGRDVHMENARGLFMTQEPTEKQRKMGKSFVYASNYGAEAGTIWANLVPKFPDLTLTAVVRMMQAWRAKRLPITFWQRKLVEQVRRDDYVEAPLSGMREHFHGQPELTKILNFPIQSTGADIINEALPHVWHSLRGIESYLIIQVHDSLVAETPYPRECARRMGRWMCRPVTIAGHTLTFPVDFKVGKSWGSVVKYSTWEEVPENEI